MTDLIPGFYGEAPVDLGEFQPLPDWQEFMHYLYLPVRLPRHEWYDSSRDGCVNLPERLEFLHDATQRALYDARETASHLDDPYVYVTARRGFATPGNPLNRPGWHCDDFGGSDLNYIWSDRYPTRLLLAPDGLTIPEDDAASMEAFDALAWQAEHTLAPSLTIEDAPNGHLLRLSPYVIHDTPVIPEPGGMRSFFKISVSTHRYNLLGNSHNHLLDYDWPMYDRATVRNQPGGNGDYVQEQVDG